MSDFVIYSIIVACVAAFVIGFFLLDRFAPRIVGGIMLAFALMLGCGGVVVLLHTGISASKSVAGFALWSAIFWGYYRRYRRQFPPKLKKAEVVCARDWMGNPIDRK